MIEWQDRALVLCARAFSNTDAILTVLTEHHGRAAGLIRGGQSRRRQADFQMGTVGQISWCARLDDQLGQFTFEGETAFASQCLDDRARLAALEVLTTLIQQTLAEREPAPALFNAVITWLEHFHEDYWARLYVRLELGLLATLGFSVDLESCALGGDIRQLSHVSPKTGRAVSRDMATPYLPRLLALPAFLGGIDDLGTQEVPAGLTLTGALLSRHVFAPMNRDLPEVRHRLAEFLGVFSH